MLEIINSALNTRTMVLLWGLSLVVFIIVPVISFMGWLFTRQDEAIRGWRNWLREDPLVHPCKWHRPDLVPPCSISSV